MNLDNNLIDLSSSEILMQLVKNIEVPLASIIEANENSFKLNLYNTTKNKPSEIIFSNSKVIADLIEEVVNLAKEGDSLMEIVPLIYKIYDSNDKVKFMCRNKIILNKISRQDCLWLIKLEDIVLKNISNKDMSLYDLSYKMVVSERQLHRKIKGLLHITPNKYIRILRLYKAKQIIDEYLYDTISQISYAVGYYDPHYFSKLFILQYDKSPKELLNDRRY